MKTEKNLCHANLTNSQDKIEVTQNKISVYNIAQHATGGRKEGYLEKGVNRLRGVSGKFCGDGIYHSFPIYETYCLRLSNLQTMTEPRQIQFQLLELAFVTTTDLVWNFVCRNFPIIEFMQNLRPPAFQ
jgi:hypothetical protein